MIIKYNNRSIYLLFISKMDNDFINTFDFFPPDAPNHIINSIQITCNGSNYEMIITLNDESSKFPLFHYHISTQQIDQTNNIEEFSIEFEMINNTTIQCNGLYGEFPEILKQLMFLEPIADIPHLEELHTEFENIGIEFFDFCESYEYLICLFTELLNQGCQIVTLFNIARELNNEYAIEIIENACKDSNKYPQYIKFIEQNLNKTFFPINHFLIRKNLQLPDWQSSSQLEVNHFLNFIRFNAYKNAPQNLSFSHEKIFKAAFNTNLGAEASDYFDRLCGFSHSFQERRIDFINNRSESALALLKIAEIEKQLFKKLHHLKNEKIIKTEVDTDLSSNSCDHLVIKKQNFLTCENYELRDSNRLTELSYIHDNTNNELKIYRISYFKDSDESLKIFINPNPKFGTEIICHNATIIPLLMMVDKIQKLPVVFLNRISSHHEEFTEQYLNDQLNNLIKQDEHDFALKLVVSSSNLNAIDMLAEIYLANGEYERYINVLESVPDIHPNFKNANRKLLNFYLDPTFQIQNKLERSFLAAIYSEDTILSGILFNELRGLPNTSLYTITGLSTSADTFIEIARKQRDLLNEIAELESTIKERESNAPAIAEQQDIAKILKEYEELKKLLTQYTTSTNGISTEEEALASKKLKESVQKFIAPSRTTTLGIFASREHEEASSGNVTESEQKCSI